jgi:hypothetical protein
MDCSFNNIYIHYNNLTGSAWSCITTWYRISCTFGMSKLVMIVTVPSRTYWVFRQAIQSTATSPLASPLSTI